ncbi:hypothetical protein [Pseudomonas sp.]
MASTNAVGWLGGCNYAASASGYPSALANAFCLVDHLTFAFDSKDAGM